MHTTLLKTVLIASLAAPLAFAAVIIDIPGGDYLLFDEDVIGDTAGPFTDTASSVTGTITTRDVTDGAGTGQSSLDFRNGGQSGIGGGDSAVKIDTNEIWAFDWNVTSRLLAVDFSGMASEPVAQIQSDAWIGASITPGSSNVTFNSAGGYFQFNGSQPGDSFNQSDMYGVSAVPDIAAGTDLVFTSLTTGGYAIGQGFTFELVPEPGTITLLLVAGGALLVTRRRKQ